MFEDLFDTWVYGLDMRTAWMKSNPVFLPKRKKLKYSASELVKNGKVYFQNKRTVLKIGEDVFMSTPEKGEKYDPEKGLLICLMKAMGMTTSDFLKLYKRAKDVSKKTKKK